MLEDRRSEILRALVEEHIRTGEPVSSRAIVERAQLTVSTATVRNDLSTLESEGFVIQPHTSAGRIPTAAAYRYYVDHLGPGRLRSTAQAKITNLFGEVHLELSKLLKATSDLLADVTDLPAVVVAPALRGDRVRSLHAVQITADQMLLIVVTERGRLLQQRARFGDHIMGWNTTVVSPPDGSMRDYFSSLEVCLKRKETAFWPAHGPEIPDPIPFTRAYRSHRRMRENEIARCLERGLCTIPEIVARLYAHVPATMHGAAARSVLAHLEYMVETGRVACDGTVSETARYRSA